MRKSILSLIPKTNLEDGYLVVGDGTVHELMIPKSLRKKDTPKSDNELTNFLIDKS